MYDLDRKRQIAKEPGKITGRTIEGSLFLDDVPFYRNHFV
jgi:hypothetical protein